MNENNKLLYTLNGFEMKLLNPDAKIMKYEELNNVSNIDELFRDTDKVILLYILENPYVGHWTTLFINKDKQGKRVYNYFDSYGEEPDEWLNYLTESQREKFNEKRNMIQCLTRNIVIIYNNVALQGGKTATCGSFVTHRLDHYQLSENEYIKKFFKDSKRSPDEIVSTYVLNKLNGIKKSLA